MISKEELANVATSARDNAYTPYSKFKVGAALLLKNGAIITGANVENASYGLQVGQGNRFFNFGA